MAPKTDDDESMLGVFLVLFFVVLSTIYVISQQQQQRGQLGGVARAGGMGGAPGVTGAIPQLAANAVSTATLSESQLRLHRSLPSRNGARAITICVDALVRNKTDATAITWASEDAPRILADLLCVGDVYILCKLSGDDAQTRERIQRFLTSSEAAVAAFEAAGNSSTKRRPLSPHRILCCTTSVGKVAFVRQIEPQVHVEVDLSVVRDLEKHVPRIVHVASAMDIAPGPGMYHVTDSFATYFDLLRAT